VATFNSEKCRWPAISSVTTANRAVTVRIVCFARDFLGVAELWSPALGAVHMRLAERRIVTKIIAAARRGRTSGSARPAAACVNPHTDSCPRESPAQL